MILCISSFHTSIFAFIYLYVNFFTFQFDNDDMKSSKRQVTFLSFIFLLKCISKSTTIRTSNLSLQLTKFQRADLSANSVQWLKVVYVMAMFSRSSFVSWRLRNITT